ncbi:hypothetical protein K488DRAFT_47039 [Vararia minispora EC-137]|uniref:Uncharacterized protein n=1 Tax=Vararia minispora EC-137 TaxID=1314806 RepID=A0ACB8QQB4_9AGAM|nr:hypothetical protein K488DRAFT_47039 [Vararia minispora EC-137]
MPPIVARQHSPTSPRAGNALRMAAASPARRKSSSTGIPGFRVAPRPKQRPIEELTLRELRDIYDRNTRILAQPAPSTSSYVPRIRAEQARIESRLLDLEGIDALGRDLKRAHLRGEEDMDISVDLTPDDPPLARAIEAKRQAVQNAISHDPVGLSMQQAMELEKEAEALDRQRKQHALEKRLQFGMPGRDETLTRQEREARIWAFMNHKLTDSDFEDDDEGEGDDPADWFEDDQDDGRKGQNLVQPDYDVPDIDPNIIRIDYGKIFEMRDGPGA